MLGCLRRASMFEFVQKRNLNSCPGRTRTTLVCLMARGMVIGNLLAVTGCQMANDCGLVRGWADVNSTGSPVAFVEQMRTNNFRTTAPRNVLHDVQIMEFPRDSFGSPPDTFEVFPVGELDRQLQQTSAGFHQPTHVEKSAGHHAEQRFVKPAGAWIF